MPGSHRVSKICLKLYINFRKALVIKLVRQLSNWRPPAFAHEYTLPSWIWPKPGNCEVDFIGQICQRCSKIHNITTLDPSQWCRPLQSTVWRPGENALKEAVSGRGVVPLRITRPYNVSTISANCICIQDTRFVNANNHMCHAKHCIITSGRITLTSSCKPVIFHDSRSENRELENANVTLRLKSPIRTHVTKEDWSTCQ